MPLLIGLGLLALLVIGVINAAQGKAKPLPVIGEYAEKWFKGIQKQKTA